MGRGLHHFTRSSGEGTALAPFDGEGRLATPRNVPALAFIRACARNPARCGLLPVELRQGFGPGGFSRVSGEGASNALRPASRSHLIHHGQAYQAHRRTYRNIVRQSPCQGPARCFQVLLAADLNRPTNLHCNPVLVGQEPNRPQPRGHQ